MPDDTRQSRTIRQRLDELYRRLRSLPRGSSADDAFRQLCETLEQVEDEWSEIQKQDPAPPPSMSDGRMYPPMDDHIERNLDITALTRGHRIEAGADGSLRVVNRVTGKVEFEK